MTVTIWGDAGGPGSHAASHDRYGRMTGACSYRDLDLELPAEGIEIDCDHDRVRVGELIHAELGDDNRLRAVAVLDGDWLDQTEQPVFFSPMYEMRGEGITRSNTYIAREAQLIGLSVTFQTARVGAHPIRWRQGDHQRLHRSLHVAVQLAKLRPAAQARDRPPRHRLARENPQCNQDH